MFSRAMALLAGTILFVPIGIYLQWWLPQDGPGELIVFVVSLPLVGIFVALRKVRLRGRNVLDGLGLLVLVLFIWIQFFVFVPQVSRRVGPWMTLRSMLVEASEGIDAKRRELGIPMARLLTSEEVERIDRMVSPSRLEYRFPLLGKSVRVRWLSTAPPYVGLNYGEGRNALFDLESMRSTYVD